MKCKKCKRQIQDNSIFCNWCGARQIAEANEVKVPQPHRKGNAYYSQITVDGERVYVTAESEEEYYTKARAAKIKLIDIQKKPPQTHAWNGDRQLYKRQQGCVKPINCQGL